jgi:hypothetical protein
MVVYFIYALHMDFVLYFVKNCCMLHMDFDLHCPSVRLIERLRISSPTKVRSSNPTKAELLKSVRMNMVF